MIFEISYFFMPFGDLKIVEIEKIMEIYEFSCYFIDFNVFLDSGIFQEHKKHEKHEIPKIIPQIF